MKKILSLLVALLFAGTAFADTCSDKLVTGARISGPQAAAYCSVFGSAVTQSLIPSAANTYDLGTAALPFRTGYFGTSVSSGTGQNLLLNAPTGQVVNIGINGATLTQQATDRLALAATSSNIQSGTTTLGLIINADANRLFKFNATSDTALSLTFGDAGTTAAQVLAIAASTADADDDSGVAVDGGGSTSVARGAYLQVFGNESANTGLAQITSGNVANSAVYVDGGHSGSPIIFRPGGATTSYWTMDSTGQLLGAGTATVGWAVVAAANQACTTTCVTPCVFGTNTDSLTADIVSCSDVTADECLCAGAT